MYEYSEWLYLVSMIAADPETAAKQIHEIVIEAVTDSLGVKRGFFLTNSQNDYNSAYYRWLLYYLLKVNTTMTSAQIAAETGGKSSGQVIYGSKKIEAELKIKYRATVLLVQRTQELIQAKVDKQNAIVGR